LQKNLFNPFLDPRFTVRKLPQILQSGLRRFFVYHHSIIAEKKKPPPFGSGSWLSR